MKPIITVLAALSLSACSWAIDQRYLAAATETCKDRGGVYEITYSLVNLGKRYVDCKDGTSHGIRPANTGANQ